MVVHLDIDHFASVNENMSVAVGDLALDLLARRLEAWLHGRGHLWRHGSDEFVAAIPLPAGVTPAELRAFAAELVRRLRRAALPA